MINQSGGTSRGGRTAQQVEQRSRPFYQDDQVERDQAVAVLRESECLFRTTFDRSVVGIAHISPEGHWLRVNQRLCDLLGYTFEELAAHTCQDLTHPDDPAASLAYIRRLLAGERDAEELDMRYLRKDGVPIWIHVTVSLVRTPQGAPDYAIAMVQDVTERKQLREDRARLLEWERSAHQEAEAVNAQLGALQALTDTALSHLALDDLLRELLGRVTEVLGVDHVGIALLDADGRTLTARAARGLGEEGVGQARAPASLGFFGRVVARRAPLVADTDALSDADFAGVPPILRERLRSVAAVPLLVEDGGAGQGEGRLVGVLGVGRTAPHRFAEEDVHLLQLVGDRIALAIDRARLYAAELAAREASRRLEEFLAVTAHDLRTPLTAVIGYLALAERQCQRLASAAREASPGLVPWVESVRGHLGEASRGAERLARLLTLLFDSSAIRAGKLELHRAPCDLAALVRARVADQRVAAPGRDIRVHLPASKGKLVPPIPVEVDADRLGQVLANYLTNALKYSPADRPADVSVEADDGWARVAVRDGGPGIPEAERGRVWELFHRAPGVEAQDTAQGGSLGLGLYICKAIIEAHGGRVGVESAVGEGSTFWFTLPVATRAG